MCVTPLGCRLLGAGSRAWPPARRLEAIHDRRTQVISRRFSRTGRFPRMDRDVPTPVDLLDEIRAALDGVDPLLGGRVVDIEMARLRVITDPMLFRRVFASLITAAVAQSEPANSITVRVARRGSRPGSRSSTKAAPRRTPRSRMSPRTPRNSAPSAARSEPPDPLGPRPTWMSLPLEPGTSSAAHA